MGPASFEVCGRVFMSFSHSGATYREGSALQGLELSGVRTLVVDDLRAASQTLSWALELLGLDVRTASDGESALQEALTFKPQIILLDIGMPGMNGFEVCRRLRSIPATASAIVVAQTGWGHSEFVKRAMDVGFDDHMVKPIDIGRLRERLLQLLAK